MGETAIGYRGVAALQVGRQPLPEILIVRNYDQVTFHRLEELRKKDRNRETNNRLQCISISIELWHRGVL